MSHCGILLVDMICSHHPTVWLCYSYLIHSGKSLIKIRNDNGSNTYLCGTPEVTNYGEELTPSAQLSVLARRGNIEFICKYCLAHHTTLTCKKIFNGWHCQRPLQNSLVLSQNRCFYQNLSSVHRLESETNWVSHDLCWPKPCCRS